MSSSTLAVGIRHLRSQLAAQQRSGESDEHLLHDFTTRRDDSAFTVLIRRHGPMVLHVCRRVLGHEQDAEDAFQATFLVLAQNAAVLRNKTALASWLHGTAYRTAMKAKQSAIRRRKHEDQTPPRPPANPSEELLWREVRALLDEEIARLPETYRSVFVLCCLENLSQTEAGQRLGVKVRTVSNRLAEARKRLAQRLRRHGVELTAVLAATALATPPVSALPVGLMASTIKAALALAAGEKLSGIVSASVAQLVKSATAAMTVGKAKTAVVLFLTASMMAGASAWAYRGLAVNTFTESALPAEPPAAKADDKPKAAPSKHETARTVEIQGRVLGPDGKPREGTKLLLLCLEHKKITEHGVTAADGRFRFSVPKSKIGDSWIKIVAAAQGCGPAWVEIQPRDPNKDLMLSLVKDDVAVEGQVIDAEGKPVVGAAVYVEEILASPNEDLTAWLEAAKAKKEGSYGLEKDFLPRQVSSEEVPDFPHRVTTDERGQFRLTGIGRERIAAVIIEGPTIVTRKARVLTRPERPFDVATFKQSLEPAIKPTFMTYYGAHFQHAAGPTKPIIGVVRDKDTKKPLAGVTIQSYKLANNPMHGEDHIRTTTDAEGRYRLTGMPKGQGNKIMAIPADDQPYVISGAEVSDSLGLGPVTVDFDLKRGVWVRGRISDKATGKGLPARVEYFALASVGSPPKPNLFLRDYPGFSTAFVRNRGRYTGSDGSFRVLALRGPGVLAVQYSDHYLVANAREDEEGTKERFLSTYPHVASSISYNAFARIDVSKESDFLKRDVTLDPGDSFTGVVLGPDGKPLAGAVVYCLSSWAGWESSPLESAEFTVRAFNPRRPRLVLFQHRQKELTGILESPKDKADSITVQLTRGATVIGRLVDMDGQPRTGAELALIFSDPKGTHSSLYSPNRIRTDAAGRFRIGGLLPGYRFQLSDSKGVIDFGGLRSGESKDLGDVQTKRE